MHQRRHGVQRLRGHGHGAEQAPYYYLFKQAAWALLGLVFLPIVMRIDYRSYRQPRVIWGILGIVTVGLVAVLFGRPVNGASRWLLLGSLGVQPSELAKIAVIFCTAALLERRMDRIDEVGYSLLPIGVTVGIIVALILVEPDLGTAVTVLMIALVMVFAAGLNYTLLRRPPLDVGARRPTWSSRPLNTG